MKNATNVIKSKDLSGPSLISIILPHMAGFKACEQSSGLGPHIQADPELGVHCYAVALKF